jgi:hypothetical protein
MSQPLYLPFYQKDAAANEANTRYLCLADDYDLMGVQLINNGAIAAHASNHLTIAIYGNDGATAAFVLTTNSGESGHVSIADATATNFVDEKVAKSRFAAGTAIKLAITKGASGESLDCAIVLKLMPARSY